jgi:hypothetical protein
MTDLLRRAAEIMRVTSEYGCGCPLSVDEQYCHHCARATTCNDGSAVEYRKMRRWLADYQQEVTR